MNKFVEKVIEKAILGAEYQLKENKIGKSLIDNGTLIDFKSEVLLLDREDGDYDLHINRKIIIQKSPEYITTFTLNPEG